LREFGIFNVFLCRRGQRCFSGLTRAPQLPDYGGFYVAINPPNPSEELFGDNERLANCILDVRRKASCNPTKLHHWKSVRN
jgi:hypothetical protein